MVLQDEQVERQVDYPTHLSGGFWTRAGRRILRSREDCWQLESATNFVYLVKAVGTGYSGAHVAIAQGLGEYLLWCISSGRGPSNRYEQWPGAGGSIQLWLVQPLWAHWNKVRRAGTKDDLEPESFRIFPIRKTWVVVYICAKFFDISFNKEPLFLLWVWVGLSDSLLVMG